MVVMNDDVQYMIVSFAFDESNVTLRLVNKSWSNHIINILQKKYNDRIIEYMTHMNIRTNTVYPKLIFKYLHRHSVDMLRYKCSACGSLKTDLGDWNCCSLKQKQKQKQRSRLNNSLYGPSLIIISMIILKICSRKDSKSFPMVW